jgi:hypothetical protein
MIPVLKGLVWKSCCDMDYFTISMNFMLDYTAYFHVVLGSTLYCITNKICNSISCKKNYMLFLLKAEYNYCVNRSHLGSHLTRGSPVLRRLELQKSPRLSEPCLLITISIRPAAVACTRVVLLSLSSEAGMSNKCY